MSGRDEETGRRENEDGRRVNLYNALTRIQKFLL
jgi:hypothetical protein